MGVCGKKEEVANLQDLLIYTAKGIAWYQHQLNGMGIQSKDANVSVMNQLFKRITNAHFDEDKLVDSIREGMEIRDSLSDQFRQQYAKTTGNEFQGELPDAASWKFVDDKSELLKKAATVGVLSTEHEDIRSLRELLVLGLKGIAAYAHHAYILDYEDDGIYAFIHEALAATTDDTLGAEELTGLVLKAGEHAVNVMALLDKANTETFGHQEPTEVNIGVGDRPGILISGHDLKDMKELLEQTKGTGVDVYTHGEMLAANAYPEFKKYDNLVGNYGGSWWHQGKEFETFNGPILMTTNCLIPPRGTYKDRIYTTGVVAYPELQHVGSSGQVTGNAKDFSAVIEQAKQSQPPTEIENGSITIGFAHQSILNNAEAVVGAVKSGAIKRFYVMAGCDGRMNDRSYFTDVAKNLPEESIILTAGCAKYRYNKLGLGDIGGIPRVIDAGQCNDSYSLAVVALKLAEVFQVDSVNDLPISFDIAWYEQKAVAVLLGLLHLGVKNIRLGPTLPAFLSPNVAKILVDTFDIKPTGTVEEDIAAMVQGN